MLGWGNNKPAWVAALPAGLSVEPVFSPAKKVCHGCGRSGEYMILCMELVFKDRERKKRKKCLFG